MELSKKLSDSWNALLRKIRKQDEVQKVKVKTKLSFPTTGVIGAIAGDCFGAAYEFHPVKYEDFDLYKEPRFTDDTVMTLAVAKWLTIDQEHTHEKLVECITFIVLLLKSVPIINLRRFVRRVFPNPSFRILKPIVTLQLSVMPSLWVVMPIRWHVWRAELLLQPKGWKCQKN